ncbi:hypothetical protein WJX74_007903 [Apatococcus lobatus]|uniref:Adenosylmethionine decarboxylase n=1 Tax=Apatococcus lobatus TaxID=904363 RepID=A0AAW1RFQ0_9CHLO
MLAPDIFPAPAFEGSEKRLELDWAALGRPVLPVPARGLRALTRQQIATLLEATGCCIVSSRSCVTFDAYVLSESSLFLYETKFVIKTCGTTKTLALVPQLLRFAADLGLAPTRCKYSRATFLFPAAQPAPYNAWEGEVELLNQLFGHLGSSHACTLGQPSAGCLQWHLFVAQAQVPPAQPATPTGCSIEICSTGLCPRQALSFHRADSNFVSAAQTTAKTGIRSLLPDADIDDYLFEPCGYSMNGLEDDGVASTIHITPEDHCSYASLEISGPVQAGSIAGLADDPAVVIRGAASIFRPRHMAVAVSWSGGQSASYSNSSGLLTGYHQMGTWTEALPDGGSVTFTQFARVASSETVPSSPAAATSPLSAATSHSPGRPSSDSVPEDLNLPKHDSYPQGLLSAVASTVSMADFGSASTSSDMDMSDDRSDASERTNLGGSWLLLESASPTASVSGCLTPAAAEPSVCGDDHSPAPSVQELQHVASAPALSHPSADAFGQVLAKFSAETISSGSLAAIDAHMASKIAEHGLEDPVWVADLGAVKRLYEAWVEAMPRVRPFYAAKCNMDPGLLAALSSLGAGFDCASEAELRAAVQAGASPGKDIVFANACKRPRDIRAAASMGVNLTTFDTPCEVQKLAQYHPGTAALLRIRADDPDARCQLGNKYGAELEDCGALYAAAKKHKLAIKGISFHVGSGATNPAAFAQAIAMARRVFTDGQKHGFDMTMLDIGGGFCGGNFGADGKVDLGGVPAAVNAALDEHFPVSTGVEIIAEPGRYFAEAPFSLGCMVFGDRQGHTPAGKPCFDYWITDGLYGAMNSLLYDHATLYCAPLGQPNPSAHEEASQEKFSSTVFGPTCDGLDTILRGVFLPRLHVGDWLVFNKMGAYTMTGASAFNGFDPADASVYYVQSEAIAAS